MRRVRVFCFVCLFSVLPLSFSLAPSLTQPWLSLYMTDFRDEALTAIANAMKINQTVTDLV
eukprot:m.120386 g.120386  ORF g.120386 m.120386 type:complete len:61 (+) comp14552_c0_seq8:1142-1324(+)